MLGLKFICKCFLISFLFTNCLCAVVHYEKESDKILRSFLKEIRPFKLQSSGMGGGMCDEIEHVSVSLDCYQNLNLEQARNLYLMLYSKLLNSYNSNQPLRPYLHNFPFNSENIEISISFKKNNHRRVDSNFIAYTFCARGKIFYDFYDHEKDDFVSVHSEDITEALKEYNKDIILKGKECGLKLY